MKIGILLPSIYASPKLFGDKIFAPRELATSLADGLIGKGHTVTVYSVPDFPTKATLVSRSLDEIFSSAPYEKFRGLPEGERILLEHEYPKHAFELSIAIEAFRDLEQGKIDLLHVYMDSSLFYSHYLNSLTKKPVVYTLHDPLPKPATFEYARFTEFAHHEYISISDNQRKSDLKLNFVSTVYHGLDLSLYPFHEKAENGFVFLGRLVHEKGVDDAIKACVIANERLLIGSQFPKKGEESEYFKTSVAPMLDDPKIQEVGMVTDQAKAELLGKAKALLFPIKWEEPFGMVMIEAMACGTPVIAYNRGSVPEIVKDGVTGYIINTTNTTNTIIKKTGIEGLVEAIKRIGEIDRKACRKHVEEHFSVKKMVEGYERVYKKL